MSDDGPPLPGQTQPVDSQFMLPDFLVFAYNRATDTESTTTTQASAMVTALINLAKLASRIAWEMTNDDGNLTRDGLCRSLNDMIASFERLEGTVDDALAEFTHIPADPVIAPPGLNALPADAPATLLPQLTTSLAVMLPPLMLAELQRLLLPLLLVSLQDLLVEALAPPVHQAIRRFGSYGRYSYKAPNPPTEATALSPGLGLPGALGTTSGSQSLPFVLSTQSCTDRQRLFTTRPLDELMTSPSGFKLPQTPPSVQPSGRRLVRRTLPRDRSAQGGTDGRSAGAQGSADRRAQGEGGSPQAK
ncbi:hypothetical protein VTO73DRAFT_2832 [Trametes versicolor]